jgi:hypothetical protein
MGMELRGEAGAEECALIIMARRLINTAAAAAALLTQKGRKAKERM